MLVGRTRARGGRLHLGRDRALDARRVRARARERRVSAGTGARPGAGRTALRALGWVAVAAVVGWFVWRAVSELAGDAGRAALRFHPGYLAASVAMLACYHLMYAGGMALILRALGARCGLPEAFALNYASNLGKYVPGGVWPVVGRYALAPKVGVSGEHAVLSAVLENALSVVAGIAVATAALGLGFAEALGVPAWLPPLAALLPLALLHPAVFGPLVRAALKAMRREATVPALPFVTLLALVAYYAV
ncbi:MAG: hypothetical protein FDZ70_11390, partial [Actinobacteria bacterium]